MSEWQMGTAMLVAVLTLAGLYRVIAGPTVFDRILGANLVSTHAVLLLALVGFLYGRIDMFVDLAISYALLNFVGAVALGKYFERGRERHP